jgi:hypothetical protein
MKSCDSKLEDRLMDKHHGCTKRTFRPKKSPLFYTFNRKTLIFFIHTNISSSTIKSERVIEILFCKKHLKEERWLFLTVFSFFIHDGFIVWNFYLENSINSKKQLIFTPTRCTYRSLARERGNIWTSFFQQKLRKGHVFKPRESQFKPG